MAEIVDLTPTTTPARAVSGLNRHFMSHVTLDLAALLPGNGDTYNVFDIPARSAVRVILERVTAEGAAATIDVLTSESSPQTLLDGADINGTGFLAGDGSTGSTAQKTFVCPAACTLDVLINAASVDHAKIRLWIETVSLDLNLNE